MTFFKTLTADRVQAIWAKFDIFLIAEFKEANPLLSESELDEAIKDGKLTLAHQESLNLDSLHEMEQRAAIKELEEYLVTKFGSVADVAEFEAWKAAN